MKTNTSKTVLSVAFAGVCFSSVAFAKEKLNLTAFKGNYNGTVTEVSSGGSRSGTATVFFTVPKSGKSARISYSATVTDGLDSTVLPTEITLFKNKTLFVTDLQVGSAGTNNAKPGPGTWSQRRRSLTCTAADIDGHTLTSIAVVKDLRRKRKLTLTLISSDGIDTRTFTTNLRAKLRRAPRS